MIASIFSPLQADPALASKKKRVLLVDSSRATRDLRSETMRRLGAEVDCAADLSEARCWWRADLYNLVLLNVSTSKGQMDKFCDDLRRWMPQQQIMFLVGKPDYLALIPKNRHDGSEDSEKAVAAATEENRVTVINGCSQRWGILEACRRISAVRSNMEARTRALRDLPGPKRDSETSRSQRKNEIENLITVAEPMEEIS